MQFPVSQRCQDHRRNLHKSLQAAEICHKKVLISGLSMCLIRTKLTPVAWCQKGRAVGTHITLNEGNGICAPWIHRSWTVKRWNPHKNNSLGPSPSPRRVKKDQQDASGPTGGDYLLLDLSHPLLFSISFYLSTSHLVLIKICIIYFGMWY